MKNILLKFLLRLLIPLIPKHRKTHRILIVSTTALGDTLWATPTIENIRRTYPNSYLAALTSPIGEQVLQNNPHLNQIFLLRKSTLPHFFSLWKTLYRERFDTILLFHTSQRLTLPLCALLGASRLIGTVGLNKGLDCLLTHPLPPLRQHEIVRRLQIGSAIGASTHTQTLSFFPNATISPRGPGPWIALHPGSKDSFKRWPKEHFIALGKRLKAAFPCEILITGTTSEHSLMQEIGAQIPGSHLDFTPRTLSELGALFNQMDLLIANDTGPVHLACALNRPLIALYSSTDPALCGPHLAPHALAISRPVSCNPCLKRRCRRPFCLLQIGPEEVFAAAQKILFPS